ncbi:hypothetical protein ABZR88_05020 [Mucilaginibacter yixingensis]|nr:hypothetical protein [Mucilaginibacter yixingensis]
MKRPILIAVLALAAVSVKAQTAGPGPVEKRLSDSLCACVTKLDLSKINTKDEAVQAYTNCVMQHADLLPDLAAEKKVQMEDQDAMRTIGIELAQTLMKQKCDAFVKLSLLMAKDKAAALANSTFGTFKRIDVKGFNYVVITDAAGSEKSFLWLREFPGSANFMQPPYKASGKKIKITWQEMEVYLPQAKGYYKVKEITGISIL